MVILGENGFYIIIYFMYIGFLYIYYNKGICWKLSLIYKYYG